jgi:iron complex outermembrane receptor protein
MDGDDSKRAYYATVEYRPRGSRARFWGRYEYRYIEANLAMGGTILDGAGESSLDYFGRRNLLPFVNHDPRIFRYYEAGFSTSTSGALGDWDFRFVARVNDDVILGDVPHLFAQAYTMLDANGNSLGSFGYDIARGATSNQPTFANTPWVDIKLTDVVPSTSGPTRNQTNGAFVDFTGSFDTGPLSHRMLIYGQMMGFRQRTIFKSLVFKPEYGGQLLAGNLNLANAFSIVHPVYREASWDLFLPPTISRNDRSSLDKYAVGIQDNIYLWDKRLLLVGGARYDFIQNNGTYNFLTKVGPKPLTSDNISKKASIVLKPFHDRGIAFFANYSTTFTARYGELVVGSGIPFENEIGISKEVGMKLELFDARLTLTGSYYDSVTKNLAIFQANPQTGLNEYSQGGRAPAKGWDTDFTWLVNDSWAILGGMGNVNSKDFRGLRLRGVMNGFNYKALVRWSAPRLSRYRGLAVGAGVVNIADRMDTTNSYVVPGYNSYDAFVSYTFRNWRFQVNGYNLSDKTAIDGIIQRSLLFVNEPRNFRFSVQYDF